MTALPRPLLGAHMPAAGGLENGIRSGAAIGCEAVQVFTSSPQQWRAKEVTDEMVARFRTSVADTGVASVVSHDSYLINLAAPDDELREKSIAGLSGELGRCARYGIDRVVSHLGAHMGAGEEAGLARTAEALRRILAETDPSVALLMETTAGQGTVLNSRFESLAWLLEALRGEARLGVCLDTCHIFAAGYDLATEDAYGATMDAFGRIVGFDRLGAVHANDSQKPLGKRVDRHAHIGEGEIGETAFRLLVNDARLAGVPVILETPEAPEGHARNLARLRSLRRV